MSAEILKLAKDLGISESQLQRLRLKYAREHGEEADEKLTAWLKATWSEARDRKWLLSRRSVPPYTESPSEAMTDAGEGVPPDEISTYRESRAARDRFQADKMDEVGHLLAVCQELRAAISSMSPERKQSMSRTLWTLKGRMDALEREIRRQLAA